MAMIYLEHRGLRVLKIEKAFNTHVYNVVQDREISPMALGARRRATQQHMTDTILCMIVWTSKQGKRKGIQQSNIKEFDMQV